MVLHEGMVNFFCDPANVGNLISSAFSKPSLDVWKFLVHIMLNPSMQNFKHDLTLPTKVRLVKAVVFPVVMYGCDSWTVKKAEC